MTREIKFRAWDFNLKKMFYNIGFIWSDVGVRFFSEQPMVGSCLQWLPEEVEIMQFTGLLDSNRKEIYEGDILEFYSKSGCDLYKDTTTKYEVRFGNFSIEFPEFEPAGIKYYAANQVTHEFIGLYAVDMTQYPTGHIAIYNLNQDFTKNKQIIGNIYQHTQLLKEEA